MEKDNNKETNLIDNAKYTSFYQGLLSSIEEYFSNTQENPHAEFNKHKKLELLYLRAISLHKLGRFQEALDFYDLCIKVDNHDRFLEMDRCKTLFELGRYTETLKELKIKAISKILEHTFKNDDYKNNYLFDGTKLMKTKSTNISYGRDNTDCKPKAVKNSNVICNLNEILYVIEKGYSLEIITEHSDVFINPVLCRIINRNRTITISQLFTNYKNASNDIDTMQFLINYFEDSELKYNDKVIINPVSWYDRGEEIDSYYCFTNNSYGGETYKYVPGMIEVMYYGDCLGYVLENIL